MTKADGIEAGRIVEHRLDPGLSPFGFECRGFGGSDDSGQVLFCSPHPTDVGMCADVVIHLARGSGGWRISSASYDGLPDNGVVDLAIAVGC